MNQTVKVLCLTLFTSGVCKSETQFNVLTYNVQMRPVLDNNKYKAPRISRRLNRYNIVSLQESFSEKKRLMQFATHPFKAHYMDKRHMFSLADSGLSTLSRFPILLTKKEHYRSYAGLSDSVASKGILLTRLDVNGQVLDLYNTHMQAGSSDKENFARLDQAAQVIEFVNTHSPSTHSVMLLGDFNMGPFRPGKAYADYSPLSYDNERDMLLRTNSFQLIVDYLGLTDMKDSLFDPKDDIERIYFRSGCGAHIKATGFHEDYEQFKDEARNDLSDSKPLVGEFTLEKTEQSNCKAQSLVSKDPPAEEVRFYKGCNYTGAWLRLKDQSMDLHSSLIMEKQISSVKLGEGRWALLAENKNGSGKQLCVKESISCLYRDKKYSFMNKRASYIRVFSPKDADLPKICLH